MYFSGIEFKCVIDPVIGCMLALEIQWGKKGMKRQQYNAGMGVTTGCCILLAEEGSFPDDATSVKEGFEGDAWFGNKAAATQVGLQGGRW